MKTRTRLPEKHRLILEIVQAAGHGTHRSMNDIYLEAKRLHPEIGHTTVYRALGRLRDLGLVREVIVPGGLAATYEPMGPAHGHFHCVRCGSVRDLKYVVPERTVRALSAEYGFEVHREMMTFEGLCRACRKTPPR